MRRNTHKPAPDGGGEVFDATIEVPVTIRNPDEPIGTHVFTAMARNDAGLRWSVVTVDNGDDAKDALDRITIPQDVLGPHRADCIAAIVDHRLGRAAEQRDQLSHRVHRGAEQPAPGRLRDAPAYGRPASRAATAGTTTALAPFSSAIGAPKLAIPAGGGQYYRPVQRGWW